MLTIFKSHLDKKDYELWSREQSVNLFKISHVQCSDDWCYLLHKVVMKSKVDVRCVLPGRITEGRP